MLTNRVKKVKETSKLVRSTSFQERDIEAENLEALKGIISYFKYLYSEGEISDKAYQTLVSQALSIFVEKSVSLRVGQAFDEVDETLKIANEVILSNLLR